MTIVILMIPEYLSDNTTSSLKKKEENATREDKGGYPHNANLSYEENKRPQQFSLHCSKYLDGRVIPFLLCKVNLPG